MPSRNDNLRDLLSGVVAKGYPWDGQGPVDTAQTPLQGYVRLGARGDIEFEAFDPDEPFIHPDPFDRPAPRAVALSTPLGGAVLVDVRPAMGMALQFGGTRESIVRLRADTLLFDVNIHALQGLAMTAVSTTFNGLGAWAGLRSLKAERINGKDGRLIGVNASVGGPGRVKRLDAAHALPKSLKLHLDEQWAYRETKDGGLAISTALELGLSARRPRRFSEFLDPLLDVQDLLSVLYRGWVEASPGRATLKGYQLEDPILWNRIAMHRSSRAIEMPARRYSSFSADRLGGVEGIARWVDLCAQHRTAVDAVAAVYREGPEAAAALLLKVGAAMEQYVAAHARTTKWGAKKTHGSYELAMAKHVGGPAFARWCGDPKTWASRFHTVYLSSKHHTSSTITAQEMDAFARGGRLLLLVALLDRIARTKVPSKTTFTSGDQEGLGLLTRRLLGLA